MKTEILFFTSKTCAACKQLLPRLESRTNQKITIIDVEEKPKIASEYFVSALPTVLFIVDGKPKRQLTGSVSDVKLEEFLKNENK